MKEPRVFASLLLNSPVPFAIIGPQGVHRQVLVRSDDAPLDLIALDSIQPPPFDNNTDMIHVMKASLFATVPRDFVVKSTVQMSYAHDGRDSYYKFAWRGLAASHDVKRIQEAFSDLTIDLKAAFDADSMPDIEWMIAPVLHLCRRADMRYRSRLQSMRFVIYASLIFYLIAFYLLLSRII